MLPTCDETSKLGHASARHAISAALNAEKRRPIGGTTFESLSVWHCDWCAKYHWGHTATQEKKDRIRCEKWKFT